jgi:hypothetical protein
MPAGHFIFSNMRGACLAPTHIPATGKVGTWTYGAGALDPAGLNDFRLLFVGGGGAVNGLDAAGVEDSLQIGHINNSLHLYEFNGDGYPQRGVIVESREIWQNNLIDKAAASTGLIQLATIAALGAGQIIGNNIGDTITDLVLYWTNNSLLVAEGIPLIRYALASTLRGQGSSLTITHDNALGLMSVT